MKRMRYDPFRDHAHRYDRWFEKNRKLYDLEVETLRPLVPGGGRGLEVGVGTGRFAVRLGVETGVEPSAALAALARKAGIRVVEGVGEALPFPDGVFDFVLFTTTVCFLDDMGKAFREAFRVLGDGGYAVIGLLDGKGLLARRYAMKASSSPFYANARFRSVEEVISALSEAGFQVNTSEVRQVALRNAGGLIKSGWGDGDFVAFRGRKPIFERENIVC